MYKKKQLQISTHQSLFPYANSIKFLLQKQNLKTH